MLKKYYVCELISEQLGVVGSGLVKVWVWNSPEIAYDALNRDKPKAHKIVNFRRVK